MCVCALANCAWIKAKLSTKLCKCNKPNCQPNYVNVTSQTVNLPSYQLSFTLHFVYYIFRLIVLTCTTKPLVCSLPSLQVLKQAGEEANKR